MAGTVPVTRGYGSDVVNNGVRSKAGVATRCRSANRPKPRLTGRSLVRGSQPRADDQSQGYWVMFRGLGLTLPRLVADRTSVTEFPVTNTHRFPEGPPA